MEPDFGRTAPEDVLLPEVIAERCVHSRMEQGSCRACVDTCPQGAWVIDDERLGIDTDRCDACGLCAPVCPEEAIVDRWPPARYVVDGALVAYAACERSGARGAGVVPCIHSLGVRALLDLHRAGIHRLLLSRGDCAACPRGGVTPVDRYLLNLTTLLEDRGLPPIFVEDLTAERWMRSVGTARARHQTPAVGRRAFFRGVFSSATETLDKLSDRADPRVPDFVPPGRLIPGSGDSRLSFHAPRIDPERCTGCDACARLCPHQVIGLGPDAYRLDPDGCTGCGICVDICAEAAVTVQTLDPSPQTLLPLHRRGCSACGVPFHSPRAADDAVDLCSICRVSPHHQRLFQVRT